MQSTRNEISSAKSSWIDAEIIRRNAKNILPILGLVLICLILGMTSKGLLFSAYNIKTIIRDTTPILIVSLGAVFIYSLGAMDISIGSVIACAGMFAVLIMNKTGSLASGIVISIFTTTIVALIIGLISITCNLMPIMTSMCFLLIGRGAVVMTTTQIGGTSVRTIVNVSMFKNTLFQIGTIVVISIVLGIIYNFTRIGKNAKAIGSNRVCAAQNGIDVVKFFVLPYLILGITVGIASIFVLSTTASISRTTGTGFEMDIMVSLILGGMPLAGGMKSKISSAIIGSFSYIILKNGLLLSSLISINQVDMVKAGIFIVIICLTCSKKTKMLP
ncbi:ABC transporter permease [[Clostridium] fimetarium]|uniref:Ribose transport system permease protein n=1 Tax=[Clostridium] fimetarium TaxID=99656 RepID=A0A1I0NEA6_9FIRM|nr:hypothetical protein [[Clostridium] fimetarium]SEV99319.1 ribose transport system permease protein [[Clostridium] fimetarium]